jgi:hypothetical protein
MGVLESAEHAPPRSGHRLDEPARVSLGNGCIPAAPSLHAISHSRLHCSYPVIQAVPPGRHDYVQRPLLDHNYSCMATTSTRDLHPLDAPARLLTCAFGRGTTRGFCAASTTSPIAVPVRWCSPMVTTDRRFRPSVNLDSLGSQARHSQRCACGYCAFLLLGPRP